ncbi:UDP-N-acetylmuramoyl-L-alanyl-D-glutamate--2,6-diaminopimelate ligase (UDP-MurNAc-L-Ala-D-Glu:meso-diaminopimelate ligase)(Meso-diaminopimelate-adding enzyme) (Meso-A2pm-adding enzyme) (UDP-N-acetylmuramyl-tripeptide synthetase) (UDP-MurNAc-tripeptidesynt [Sulfurihydrogenibium azorense Az-Fu1]|jgi:UDP-N-acetylmuramoyl-L-alanyl-D-glutamate--2,6-diaminopimelate ligase|uniref:UDP-N-acetylmuramoyl-L-alanyl-D-glutamate--2,6-diaminopimelate ligase n=1 Tax=Sulfurihydrogenibium azorense (strain DSM 15241 / OCM 825 / Az-Fu1) TaxID=204536 RepID=C1DUK9_SULAA|nr:UDP-N-acetylmuramoyl-L-alanyl-D-glutamate--2,6-diaminopimelate ligase [Sulfurihydrogenibium azorense]ACN99576.1 UDP-N-acetylmuramoyl-L-alanyl-D-glutamate--2,6-diaminopimelate ligase (UDP-MurNAc-L-Ala-D-Glu:meso-diaminopimelate ligase)(Meso-diaminopimelate-adding enzyme) (Meso-A2pm-adding enzyme) (UDP-N-acetylmuramyl-tripeptide synthetase) (UDP-MurNAc-tripeptidesynt [Sulfurihydrogenibium azorense Az-Fu1]
MKELQDLLTGEKVVNLGKSQVVKGITNNSSKVQKDYAFFAIKGNSTDGHHFIEDAITKGASTVFIQDTSIIDTLKRKYPYINIVFSENTRKSLATASNKFYNEPSKYLKVIGITGTNGKTSVSNLLAQYYENAGYKVGVIGTINYRIGDEILSSGHTTPDPVQWFETLNLMKEKGCDVVVAEVSSHAAHQFRVYSTLFHGGIFTNLTQDHLDYHGTMENYFLAKREFFNQIQLFNDKAIASVNIDDPYGKRIYNDFKEKIDFITYGFEGEFKIKDYNLSLFETLFNIEYKGKTLNFKTKLRGLFNVYNLSASISFLIKDGFDIDFLKDKTLDLKPIRGRFEVVEAKDFIVVIDYAHTPDALENILKSLNQIKQNRVITVFGAGGNRDRTKRPLMGKVAQDFSDIVILTSDNPRFEDPNQIIKDILEGITQKSKVIVEPDRKKAIEYAIKTAQKGDIVLIAGKGHENYQIIKDQVIPFDDKEVVNQILKEI